MPIAVPLEPVGGVCRSAAAANSAYELFRRHLAVVPAESDELLDHAYRLRFQVYCIEHEFENAAEHPDGRERDRDDSRSLHFLVLDRLSGRAVGTVRLILPRIGDDLPVLRLIGASRRWPADLPLETTGEVSRFAIAKVFRRQLQASWRSIEGPITRRNGTAKSAFPLVTYGLIQAVLLMSRAGNITHVVAMMEPALLRLLRRVGVEFQAIGDPVQHHGMRQPSWAVVAHLIDRVRDCHRELWEIATRSLATQPQPSVLGCCAARFPGPHHLSSTSSSPP
jgi:N-acyl amino acid synthase of PEP-CTERM/exosortase system